MRSDHTAEDSSCSCEPVLILVLMEDTLGELAQKALEEKIGS